MNNRAEVKETEIGPYQAYILHTSNKSTSILSNCNNLYVSFLSSDCQMYYYSCFPSRSHLLMRSLTDLYISSLVIVNSQPLISILQYKSKKAYVIFPSLFNETLKYFNEEINYIYIYMGLLSEMGSTLFLFFVCIFWSTWETL